MIPLIRDRAHVPAPFKGAGRGKNEAKLLQQPGPDRTFDSTIWKKAKEQLKRESHSKCAYCDSPAAAVAHCDVEHFRPKSVYWWLAYCYDNYLFACQICNQSFKSDHFPIDAKVLRAPTKNAIAQHGLAPDPVDTAAVIQWVKVVSKEKALLLNPYFVDPAAVLRWEADDVLKEVAAAPRKKSGHLHKQAVASIDKLGLNREELLKWRHAHYATAAKARAVIEQGNAPAQALGRDLLKSLTDPDHPYSGMIRYFVDEVWQLNL